MNKDIIKKTKNSSKQAKISEKKAFLTGLLNHNVSERKRANNYVAALNHNIKLIKELLDEVK